MLLLSFVHTDRFLLVFMVWNRLGRESSEAVLGVGPAKHDRNPRSVLTLGLCSMGSGREWAASSLEGPVMSNLTPSPMGFFLWLLLQLGD